MSGDHGAAQRVCDVCLRKWSPASPPPVIGEEQWTPDTRQCESCGTPFTWRRRRHHCRFCGLCVCDACSTGRIKAPGFSTARPAAATGAAYMVQEGLRAPARVGEQPPPPTVGQELTINRTQKKQAVVCGSVHNDEDESQPVARAAALPRRHLDGKTNQPGGQTVGGDVTRWNEMAVCKIVISMDDGDDEPEYGTGVLCHLDILDEEHDGSPFLITNHHVLPDEEEARRSVAIFQDMNGVECRVTFDPDGDGHFWTDKEYDFTIVELKEWPTFKSVTRSGQVKEDIYRAIELKRAGEPVALQSSVRVIQYPLG
eukprot:Stramenopile-MAST_4_protein_5816